MLIHVEDFAVYARMATRREFEAKADLLAALRRSEPKTGESP